MTYHLKLELEGLPAMGMNSRRHWRTVYRENAAWGVRMKLATRLKLPPEPLRLARLKLTRYSSSEPDFDNLVTSFKPILDALTELGVIRDDKMSCIGQPDYDWQKAAPSEGRIVVEVWQAEPPHGLDCTR